MVSLVAFSLDLNWVWARDHLNLVPLDQFSEYLYKDRGISATPVASAVTLINSAPESLGSLISAAQTTAFYNDFYFRVHVLPASIALGNMVSTQTRDVEVWNAWSEPKTLDNVVRVNAEGITVTEPEQAPITFGQLETKTYTVNIASNGPPIVDAAVIYDFGTETPKFTVIGRRVVLWPFVPETGHEEELAWNTDIIQTFAGEQRLALREAPRQSFNHQFLLDEYQFSRAKAISTQWAHRVYGIAVWSEVTQLKTGLAAGATFIPFDTSFADYRANDLVILWVSDTQLLAVEISTVQSNGVNLKLPLESAWPACFVAPMRFVRALNGVEYTRNSNHNIIAKAKFDVTENKDLGDNGSFPMYRGKPVLTDRTIVVGDISERISRTVDMFDNGSGPIEVEVQNNWVRHLQMVGFYKNSRANMWSLRKWVHARRGKQRAFWLPSWNPDLILKELVTSTSLSLVVAPIGYPLYYSTKDIMVLLKNGTKLFARITSGENHANGSEILYLTAGIGGGFTPEDVDLICFISHVRLDSDQITFSHPNYGQISTSIPVTEVPE